MEAVLPHRVFDESGEKLGRIGNEFGTVTGRERRCGWFDAVLVRQTVQISGIALTKLDVLDTFEKINICVGYELDGKKKIDYASLSEPSQNKIIPPMKSMMAGSLTLRVLMNSMNFPLKAMEYIKRIEELISIPIRIISTSPNREDIIFWKAYSIKL